jgi:hypothetical protein
VLKMRILMWESSLCLIMILNWTFLPSIKSKHSVTGFSAPPDKNREGVVWTYLAPNGNTRTYLCWARSGIWASLQGRMILPGHKYERTNR